MQPGDLNASSFLQYPPRARALAVRELPSLRQLPLTLAPILLRELISYDWKLPGERAELNKQFLFLNALTQHERSRSLEPFRSLSISAELSSVDWVNDPAGFMERLTAWLWSTHQMDRFRAIADDYSRAVADKIPEQAPALSRLGIVIIGAGVQHTDLLLFRKLRPHGVHFTALNPEDGLAVVLEKASRRAAGKAAVEAPLDSILNHW